MSAVPGLDRLVLASANPKKVAEMAAILAEIGPEGVEVVPRPGDLADVVEDADTLLGNARLKAVAVCAHTDQPAVADDTGLFVDALDGAPGVISARYAGEPANDDRNVTKLLAELDACGATTPAARRAEFRTVIVVALPNGDEVVADGVCAGTIIDERRGAAGFGYDPVFVPDDGDGRTFAEMSSVEKAAMSHRGRALAALADQLR